MALFQQGGNPQEMLEEVRSQYFRSVKPQPIQDEFDATFCSVSCKDKAWETYRHIETSPTYDVLKKHCDQHGGDTSLIIARLLAIMYSQYQQLEKQTSEPELDDIQSLDDIQKLEEVINSMEQETVALLEAIPLWKKLQRLCFVPPLPTNRNLLADNEREQMELMRPLFVNHPDFGQKCM
jgi:hypothetical protein